MRTGSTLSHYAAEGNQGDFELLRDMPFGDTELKLVRLIGSTGSDRAALDVRVTDIRIRAESLTGVPESQATSEPVAEKPPPKGWLGAAVIVGAILLVVVAVGVWFFVRHRRAEMVAEPAEAHAAEEEQAESITAPTTISVVCGACGKTLKAGVRLAGKKVKCPKCQHAVLVPTIEKSTSHDDSIAGF